MNGLRWYRPWGWFAGLALLMDIALAVLCVIIATFLYRALFHAARCTP